MKHPMLLRAGQVLLGPRDQRLRGAAVLIEGTLITAVADTAELAPQPHWEVIDLGDNVTVMPGLVNGFVRLAFGAGDTPYADYQGASPEELSVEASRRAETLLRSGVTTARDMGGPPPLTTELRRRIDRGELAGPRLLTAGTPLTAPAGEGAILGGEVELDAGAISDAVDDRVESGADFICYHDSGGYILGRTPVWGTQFPPDQVANIVDRAHHHGLPVSVHAYSRDGVQHGVGAGVDFVEHMLGAVHAPDEPREVTFRRDDATAEQMARRGTVACIPSGRNRKTMIADWGEQAAIDKFYYRYRWLDELGVPLLPGNTAGSINAPFDDFVSSLETYEFMGFEGARTLELATAGAARLLGLEARTGRLAAGLEADVIAVDGDPTSDLQSLRRPRLVISRGTRVA